ncbi:MAG: hypothetical protein C0481_17085 [Phenylobacterium sp.]|uniref:hypothetical protein n=1 Tax=Phenylobacterium sp. TaxID=1871053 RepID=UPI0025E759F5|nr:hypothetical protein [Phenylobacterium sp.]MBA4013579.1 hypothetical protein [Phenylobacterium sp.]
MRIAAPLGLALALAASQAPGLACAAPPIEAAFGNTVVSTFPDGKTQHIWFDAGGAYTAVGRRGQRSSGRWSLRADEICLRQLRPFPAPILYCTPVPDDAATAAWTSKALDGQPVRLKLVRGRFGP